MSEKEQESGKAGRRGFIGASIAGLGSACGTERDQCDAEPTQD